MNIHFLQHVSFEKPGYFNTLIQKYNCSTTFTALFDTMEFPALENIRPFDRAWRSDECISGTTISFFDQRDKFHKTRNLCRHKSYGYLPWGSINRNCALIFGSSNLIWV